ncbi:MAG: GAF domain-containing protein [Rhodoferax sp.]|nr:GAF domain-containing protein [Rhodoferax sp.]
MNVISNHTDWTSQCEAEPLPYSNAIQAHGGLLHLNEAGLVTHASANLAQYYPCDPASLCEHVLPEKLGAALQPALSTLGNHFGSRAEWFNVDVAGHTSVDIVASRSSQGIVLELCAHQQNHVRVPAHSVPMRTPSNAQSAQALHQHIAGLLKDVTGFNRVMIYAFREDGDGEVLAEARNSNVYGSYLGLRFPAADIPQIARNLYKKNPWRLIPDSQAPTVPLLGHHAEPPDLTWSDLRSVSPVHQSYLANMGVRASLSLPILVGTDLWGLVACHHAEPRVVPLKIMRAASHITRHYALLISTWMAESRMRLIDRLNHTLDMVCASIVRHTDLVSAMPDIAPILFDLFDASGLAIRQGNVWARTGDSPSLSALEYLSAALELSTVNFAFVDSLYKTYPTLEEMPVAGALAIKIRTRDDQCLQVWLFRVELLQEVHWGGNPEKPVELQSGRMGIAPRRSFEKWVEKRRNHCRQWMQENQFAAKRLRQSLIDLFG